MYNIVWVFIIQTQIKAGPRTMFHVPRTMYIVHTRLYLYCDDEKTDTQYPYPV